MQQSTYLFYDIETTGLNCCFDQILQFAAIRTDLALNEIERHNIQVKLRDDVIPSPYALITHRISLDAMQDNNALNEYEAIKKIHQLVNQPGTISLGYNTLGFDDEFLRFSFHRNLLTPYTHQYANQCNRMDIYPITVTNYLYGNSHIKWPIINEKVSLKLEAINQHNNWVSGQAHNALVDVEATIALAKQLFKNQEMWQYLTGYFNKATDLQRLSQCPIAIESNNKKFRHALLIQGKFGYNNKFQAPVLHLGSHQQYKNQTLLLRLDQAKLRNVTADNIDEHCQVIRKKLGEGCITLAPQKRFMQQLDADRISEMNQNIQWLGDNVDLLFKIAEYYQTFQYDKIPNIDIDAALYELDFPSQQLLNQFKQFHRATVTEKLRMLESFTCPKRQQQARRILQRNFATIIDKEKTNYTDNCTDYKGNKLYDSNTALKEINEIERDHLDTEQISLLASLRTLLENKR